MVPTSFSKAESRKMAPTILWPERKSQHASGSQTHTSKLGDQSFSHKVWALFKGLLLHGVLGQVSLHTGPLRALPQVAIALQVSWALEPLWSSKPNVLQACLSGAGLSIWGAWCTVQSFIPQKELLYFEFPPDSESLYWGWGLLKDYVPAFPTCFDVVSLSFARYKGVALPVFRFVFFPKGYCSICSCKFSMSVGGGEFRISCISHLELNSPETKCVYRDTSFAQFTSH